MRSFIKEELEIVYVCYTYFSSKTAQAKRAFYKKKNLFVANTVSLETRKTLGKSFVWSIAVYGTYVQSGKKKN